jgi:hypothetical protein
VQLVGNATLATVNMGGHWPDIMATDSTDRLLHIYGDLAGWHADDTGVKATTVAAVDMGGQYPYTILV